MSGTMILSNKDRDLGASILRAQLQTIHKVLEIVECSNSNEDDYIFESLRIITHELRQMEKLLN